MKPGPEGILHAQSTFEAERAYLVGDAWLDGTAAKRANVPFIAFRPSPDAFEGREVDVWRTVQYLSELPDLL